MAAVPLSHMKLSTMCELRPALRAGASRGDAGLQRQQSDGGGAVVAHGAQHEVRAEASPLGWVSQGGAGLQRQQSGGGGTTVARTAQHDHEVRAEASSTGWGVARRRRAVEAAVRQRRCRCRT